MARAAKKVAATAVLGAYLGCAAFGSEGDRLEPPASSSDGAAGSSDGAPGATTTGLCDVALCEDDAGEADAGAVTPVDTCSGKAGPKGIRVGSLCIDETEVTNEQYDAFVASLDGGLQPVACAWNTKFSRLEPGCKVANLAPKAPATCLDWCDAFAYCRWAGKRLCGHAGGGPLTAPERYTPTDAWHTACSMNSKAFPYGAMFNVDTCVADRPDAGAPNVVASRPGCVGGAPGLFDMSGNVQEWTDDCPTFVNAGSLDGCILRGGGFKFVDGSMFDCHAIQNNERRSRYDDVGFRCCGHAPTP